MKKLNLLLITLLFSSLLVGCGMKGPLYRAPQTTEKQQASETKVEEQNKEIVKSEENAS